MLAHSKKSRTFAPRLRNKATCSVKTGCSTVGSILGLGPRGRTFESCHPDQQKEVGAFSSAGSERLPYKQRVGGSNPSTPTKKDEVDGERQSPMSTLTGNKADGWQQSPPSQKHRDVVQLVVYLVWDQGVARSSRVIPTNKKKWGV